MSGPGGPRSGRLVSARNPGEAAELDAFLGQRLGFLVGGLAVDAALVALAVVDLARLLGELVADMLAVLLDVLAHLEQRLAQLLGHMSGESSHLLLFGGRDWRRRCSRGGLDTLHLAAFPQPRRHDRALDLQVAADRAADQGLLFLPFVGLAVLEPTFKLVAFGAAQAI